MILGWELWALVASIAFAAYIEANRFFKMDGVLLVLVRSAACAVLFAPIVIWLNWSTNPLFYLAAIGAGVLTMLADTLLFGAVAKHGGRLGSLYKPLKIWIVFMAWLVVSPAARMHIFGDPLIGGVVFLCLILCSAGLFMQRQHDGSWRGLLPVLPVALAFSVADIAIALSGSLAPTFGSLIIFVFINFLTQSIVAFPFYLPRGGMAYLKAITQEKWLWQQAFVMAAITAVAALSMFAALMSAPNPSYVTAIGLLSVVWLQLYHKIVKTPDEGSAVAAILFVCGAVGLALLE